MTYKPLDPADLFDLRKFDTDAAGLNALIAHLEAITAPEHDDKHVFEEDPNKKGVCIHCGWVHPDVPAICKEHNAVYHLKELIDDVKKFRDGTSRSTIEVTVIFVPIPTARRDLFG